MKSSVLALSLFATSAFCMDGAGIYAARCAMCHGVDGKEVAITGKAIAGAADAEAKILGYKKGTIGGANKASMQGAVADIGDADIKAVGAYVTGLK
jgi:cytochrome c